MNFIVNVKQKDMGIGHMLGALDDRKHGYLANVQGTHLANGMLATAAGKTAKPYSEGPMLIVTSTGTGSGVASLPFSQRPLPAKPVSPSATTAPPSLVANTNVFSVLPHQTHAWL